MKRSIVAPVLLGLSLAPLAVAQAAPPAARTVSAALRTLAADHRATTVVEGVPLDVVASGLDNPRGLAFGPDGALYIAEAGRGGDGPCRGGAEGEECFGPTGAITRVKDGVQTRVVEGLPSFAGEGFGAIGPVDVSVRSGGFIEAVIGWGGPPEARMLVGPAGALFGHVIRVHGNGKVKTVRDVSAYEGAANPDGGEIDTNPYALLSVPGGEYVADAGGNSLLHTRMGGGPHTSVVAVFPDRLVPAPPFLGLPAGAMIPMQAVPTCVAEGPDGALYVGQLTGFPFPPGGANVYRIDGDGPPTVYASGFTNIIDIAFGPHGELFVLEISRNGLLSEDPAGGLFRVPPGGGPAMELPAAGLIAPGGIAVGPDGALYVSNYGVFPGAGEVIRLAPPPPGPGPTARAQSGDAIGAVDLEAGAGATAVRTGLFLAPATPNPLSDGTRFEWGLATAGHATLEIVDLQGRHVRTLASGSFEAGAHVHMWDGRSDGGALVRAGTYFARLVTEEGARSTRVAVVN